MSQKIFNLCALLIVVIALISCSPATIAGDAAPTATAVATNTSEPSIAATHTPLPLPAHTGTPDLANFTAFCQKNMSGDVDGYATDIDGVLAYVVLENAAWQSEGSQTGLIGGPLLQARPFPPETAVRVIGFSPDGRWFAYMKDDDSHPSGVEPFVYLLSVEGQQLKTALPLDMVAGKPYLGFSWISNELLMIQYISLPASGFGSYLVESYAIFNAFTGEDGQDILDGLPYRDQWQAPYFSPDMTRAAYLSQSYDQEGIFLILWDLSQQTILWATPFHSIFGGEETIGLGGFSQAIFWSADSQAFIYSAATQDDNSDEAYASYLVDRDGAEARLLLHSADPTEVMSAGGFWSPDGRFVYTSSDGGLIYDLAIDEIVAQCGNETSNRVVWSPDSQYLASIIAHDDSTYLHLFHLYSGEMRTLGKVKTVDGFPVWLENEAWLQIP